MISNNATIYPNVNLGKKLLSESGLAITAADDLADAAAKAVAAAKGDL